MSLQFIGSDKDRYIGYLLSGRDVVLVDDMIITGNTLLEGLEELRKREAEKVYAYCSHGVFVGDTVERIN